MYGPCLQGSPPGKPGDPKPAPGNRITVPFAAGKGSGRGLASCQAKGFPKVKLDARERSHPGSARYPLGKRGPGDPAQRTRIALTAAVAGLDAEPPRSPRDVARDVGTTMTTGRESAERVSPKGQFEETVGVDLG